MFVLLIYLLLALAVSFLCSILEAALLSMPPSFVRQQQQSGSKAGALLAEIKSNIDRPIAAILTLNTVAHTVGAAGVGAQAVAVFGEAYFGLISAVLTFLILVFSEIIPKTIGAQYWRSLTSFTAYTCRAIVVGTLPLVWLSEQLTKLMQPKDIIGHGVSRDEVVALAQVGLSEGVLDETESRVIGNLIRLRGIRVESIMTPRLVLGMVSDTTTCEGAMAHRATHRFSRILVYSDSPENVVGYALRNDILRQVANDEHDKQVGALKRPIRIVSEFATVSSLFRTFVANNEQIALVVDEFGGTSGVVTMEDIIETLLGLEIVDESDRDVDMRELARQRMSERKAGSGAPEEPGV